MEIFSIGAPDKELEFLITMASFLCLVLGMAALWGLELGKMQSYWAVVSINGYSKFYLIKGFD